MTHTTFEHASRMATALMRDLEDTPTITAKPLRLAEVFGVYVFGVEVTIDLAEDSVTVVYSPRDLDDGTGGVDIDKLIEIRRLAGQDVAERVRTLDPPGRRKHFTDLMTLDPIQTEDLPPDEPVQTEAPVTRRKRS